MFSRRRQAFFLYPHECGPIVTGLTPRSLPLCRRPFGQSSLRIFRFPRALSGVQINAYGKMQASLR